MNYLFNMQPVMQKLDQIGNLDSGTRIAAAIYVDEMRSTDREQEIIGGLDAFLHQAEAARERRIAEQRARDEQDRLTAYEIQVAGARAAARANPLHPTEILRRVTQRDFTVRLNRKGELRVSPDSAMPLELEAYLCEFADAIAAYLRARARWRTVATVAPER